MKNTNALTESLDHYKSLPVQKRTGMCNECQFEYFDGVERHAPNCKQFKS